MLPLKGVAFMMYMIGSAKQTVIASTCTIQNHVIQRSKYIMADSSVCAA